MASFYRGGQGRKGNREAIQKLDGGTPEQPSLRVQTAYGAMDKASHENLKVVSRQYF